MHCFSSCALSPVLVLWGRHVSLLFPEPQYSFLNLSSEIVWQVNDVAVPPFAIVRLIRSLWHLNEGFLAFELNNPYLRNANEATYIHRRKTSKWTSVKFSYFFVPNIHSLGLLHVKPKPRVKRSLGLSLNVERFRQSW